MKKIGLLGGTFDPIHNGHLIIAEFLRDELDLDEIRFILAKIHPLKNFRDISPADVRWKMLELAIEGNGHFKSCDIELKREGISYTIDTLNQLHDQETGHPVKYFYFIGMDNVNEMGKWREPLQVLQKCQMVAFGRPGFQPVPEVSRFLSAIQFVHVPLLEISSTLIRERVRKGQSIRYLVPEGVRHYILERHLYQAAGK